NVINVTEGTAFASPSTPALRIAGTSGGVPFETVAAFNNTTLVIQTPAATGTDTVTLTSIDDTRHANTNLTTNPQGTRARTAVLLGGDGKVTVAGNLTFLGPEVEGASANLMAGGTVAFGGNTSFRAAVSVTQGTLSPGPGPGSPGLLTVGSATFTPGTNFQV